MVDPYFVSTKLNERRLPFPPLNLPVSHLKLAVFMIINPVRGFEMVQIWEQNKGQTY